MTDKQKREERVAAALERIATTLEGILELVESGIESDEEQRRIDSYERNR
jgi:hypothetical protein